MLKKLIYIAILFYFSSSKIFAHGTVPYIFALPTTQTSGEDIITLDVSHRYLDVNRHTTNVTISVGYGISEWWDMTIGYAFKNKDGIIGTKFNLLDDTSLKSKTSIISLSINAGLCYKDVNLFNDLLSLTYINRKENTSASSLERRDRLSYFTQLIIQKNMINNKFFMGFTPIFADNTNFYEIKTDKKDYSIGYGAFIGFFVNDKISLDAEIVMNIYGFAYKKITYNTGIKYASYRHTFSIWIGNSYGYSPVEYITGNTDLYPKLGFAFTREFDL